MRSFITLNKKRYSYNDNHIVRKIIFDKIIDFCIDEDCDMPPDGIYNCAMFNSRAIYFDILKSLDFREEKQ